MFLLVYIFCVLAFIPMFHVGITPLELTYIYNDIMHLTSVLFVCALPIYLCNNPIQYLYATFICFADLQTYVSITIRTLLLFYPFKPLSPHGLFRIYWCLALLRHLLSFTILLSQSLFTYLTLLPAHKNKRRRMEYIPRLSPGRWDSSWVSEGG